MDKMLSLEETALLGLIIDETEAYGSRIFAALHERIGREANRGATARSLRALEIRGYLLSRKGEPSEHGGPKRVYYRIAPSGKIAYLRTIERFKRAILPRRLSPQACALLLNPPPGSKVAQARDYGADLMLLARSVLLSPTERFAEAIEGMNFANKIEVSR